MSSTVHHARQHPWADLGAREDLEFGFRGGTPTAFFKSSLIPSQFFHTHAILAIYHYGSSET